MKNVKESQKYFDFGQRLRFIAASAAINIYRFAPRLLRYGGTSRVKDREAHYVPRVHFHIVEIGMLPRYLN